MIDDDELHKLWEGLGYYNRVRNMKKCAQMCVEKYDGKLPGSYEELLKLPGIGEYTAGAIASIAFHEAVPAVDGNVLRVFSRLMVSEDDILNPKTKSKFQAVIQAMMPTDRPDEFNPVSYTHLDVYKRQFIYIEVVIEMRYIEALVFFQIIHNDGRPEVIAADV